MVVKICVNPDRFGNPKDFCEATELGCYVRLQIRRCLVSQKQSRTFNLETKTRENQGKMIVCVATQQKEREVHVLYPDTNEQEIKVLCDKAKYL